MANGSEEIETVTIVDTLRRAEIDVTLAKVKSIHELTDNKTSSLTCKMSRGVQMVRLFFLNSVDS